MSDELVIYENISQCLTLKGATERKGRCPTEEDLGIIENASMVVDLSRNTIIWVGETSELPKEYENLFHRFSSEGEVWLPEFIDCHTHAVFSGERHHEYALKVKGKSYQEIANAGGGILSTMKNTRNASLEELIQSTHRELEKFQRYGVGVLEIKSGYGLSLESELKILECIKAVQEKSSVFLIPTFMPAHALPPEFSGRIDQYVDTICNDWLLKVSEKKLAKCFDVFVEEGYFSVSHAEKMCRVALESGFSIKLHTDQFKDIGGTQLGIELGALSLDHLDHISDENIKKIASSQTVAVLCPGASLFSNTPFPPARKMIDAGVQVALSTDYNPGTSPTHNLPLMTTIACSQMKMTVSEVIVGITYNAACALGIQKDFGSLEPGKQFRVTHLNTSSYEVLPYSFGELD